VSYSWCSFADMGTEISGSGSIYQSGTARFGLRRRLGKRLERLYGAPGDGTRCGFIRYGTVFRYLLEYGMAADDIIEAWFRKLTRLMDLDGEELAALTALSFRREETEANRYLVKEGTQVTRCCLLVDGYVARHKMSRNGRRQIVSFHMSGDMLDLQHTLLSRADHNLQTMTRAVVAWIPITELAQVASRFPRVAAAFARDALIDAAIFREWVLNVGARDAKTRIAHMLCEFVQRREALGIASVEAVELPFSQEQIGDATGLTSVHVNRMLRELTEEGAFARTGRHYCIADWRKLQAIADFNPAYLHQMA